MDIKRVMKYLEAIGSMLKNSVRKEDIVARYGGEEFAIIFPNTSEKDAIKLAENIRSKIEKTYFDGEENQPNGKLTVSIGISIYPDKAKNALNLLKVRMMHFIELSFLKKIELKLILLY